MRTKNRGAVREMVDGVKEQVKDMKAALAGSEKAIKESQEMIKEFQEMARDIRMDLASLKEERAAAEAPQKDGALDKANRENEVLRSALDNYKQADLERTRGYEKE